MALNPNLFWQQIDKKTAKKYELLNSSVRVLMVYRYKDVLKDVALDLVGSFEGLLYFVDSFG